MYLDFYNCYRVLHIMTWNINMLKIQHVFKIRKILYLPKAQITFRKKKSWHSADYDDRLNVGPT